MSELRRFFRTDFGIALAMFLLFLRAFYWEILPASITYSAQVAGTMIVLLACVPPHLDTGRNDRYLPMLWMGLAAYLTASSMMSGVRDGRLLCLLSSVLVLALLYNRSSEWFATSSTTLVVMLAPFAIMTIVLYFAPQLYGPYVRRPLGFESPFPNPGKSGVMGYKAGLTTHFSYNGSFCVLGFILSFCRCFGPQEAKRKVPWGISATLYIVAVMLTTKRAMLLYGLLAPIITYLILRGKEALRRLPLVLAGCIALSIVLYLTVPGIRASFSRLFDSLLSDDVAETTSGRVYIWAAAIDGWLKSPLLGMGWGTFEYVWKGGTVTVVAHNEALHMLHGGGLIGLALLLTCCAWSMAITVQRTSMARKVRLSKNNLESMFATSLCIQVYSLMYAFTGGTLMVNPYTFEPYFLAIALALSCTSAHIVDKSQTSGEVLATTGLPTLEDGSAPSMKK